MPSRKNESSDSQSTSRRSSLRRLSSIASFQALFSRRRSNNVTNPTTNSSSSNLSLSSSTIANAPEPIIEAITSHKSFQDEDPLGHLPQPSMQSQFPARKSGYFCLPDDPIGGMPRSRTFSNLPLPTKSKKTVPLVSSKSQSRLPSAFLPSTRLPSPPMSTRKHSHTRLASAGTNIPIVCSRMKRSDTEPLLGVKAEQPSSSLPRPTAFKENITLSPIKPLPAIDMSDYSDYHSLSPTSESYAPYSDQGLNERDEPLVSANFASSLPSSGYPQYPALRMAKEYKSSPLYRSAKDRPPTPGGSKGMDIQRWYSQPVLTNATNTIRYSHQSREIKQTRLMSARQPPTPPLAKTAITTPTVAASKLKHSNNSGHIRQTSVESPTKPNSTPKKKPPSPRRRHLEIHNREPPSYWLGRLCALVDRYRNEELATLTHQSPSKPNRFSSRCTPKSHTDKLHTPEATTARLRRAFEDLHDLCMTPEAKESLIVFQVRYASVVKNPELSRPIVLNAPAKAGDEEGDGVGDLSQEVVGMSEGRKMTFMDRLLGRPAKRRSAVLS